MLKIKHLSYILFLSILAFSPYFANAESIVVPNDPHYEDQWYLDKISAPSAWAKQKSSDGVVIAVLDTGVQTDNPDLKDNIWTNKGEIPDNGIDDDNNGYVDDVNGWDFIHHSNDPNPKYTKDLVPDEVSHGTIVAGIAAAKGNNNEGVAGIAWNVKIMPLLVLDEKGSGDTRAVINAIDYAVRNGADIINMSFAGSSYSADLEAAIRRAYRAGVLVVAAAGNNVDGEKGRNLDYLPMYPVCNDGYYNENMVLGVTATDAMDQKPYFSAYGTKCVDLSAPGVSIYSTSVYHPIFKDGKMALNSYYDGYWSGTSMAAPQVSGAAALVIAANPSLTRQEVFDILLGSSDYIEKLNPGNIGQLGAGRLNVDRAIMMAKERLALKKVRIADTPAFGTSSTVTIHDLDGSDKKEIRFSGNYRGELNIASGDLNGDGKDELVVGAGKNGGPQVQVFSSDGKLLKQFFAYNKNFRGGVKVAVGDIDGDGRKEIVTAAGPGGGPHIRVFNFNGELLRQFFAFDEKFRGGVNVAVGDLSGDDKAEILVSAGIGGGPQIRIFDSYGKTINQFFAYAKDFRGGVNIAVADIDGGLQKHAEIITAPMSNGSSQVRIFNYRGEYLSQFYAFDPRFHGQTNVASGDIDQDGLDEIICGAGAGGSPHVRIFKKDGSLVSAYYAFDAEFQGGVSNSVLTNK